MLTAILTGVTFLVVTHSALGASDTACEGLINEVQNTWTAAREGFPELVESGQGRQFLAQFGLISTPELGPRVKEMICRVSAAETVEELAIAVGVPEQMHAQFKLYYGMFKSQYRKYGMIEGVEAAANVIPTLLVAFDEAGLPQWPLTKTYEEWLWVVGNLIDEVGADFVRYLLPDLPENEIPIFEDPQFLARQLTDATSLNDFARRINVDQRMARDVFQVFERVIQMGKVDEAVTLVAAVYDLINYADSLSLLSLEDE